MKTKIRFVSISPDRAIFQHRGKSMEIYATDDGVAAKRSGRPRGQRGFMFVNPAPVDRTVLVEALAVGQLTPEIMEIGETVGEIFERAWAPRVA